MKNKKFFIGTVTTVLVILLLIMGIQIVIDPLFLYHRPILGMRPIVVDERYQNAGMAKNFEFDNVIMGNSMCENFQSSWFEGDFTGKTIKLVASGSHPLDWTYLLELLQNRTKPVQKIVLNLDYSILTASSTKLKHDLPIYLYDNSLFNDVRYWFNFSIIKNNTFKTIEGNLKQSIPDMDTVFSWDDGTKCGEEIVRLNYQTTDEKHIPIDIEESIDISDENINLLQPYIEKMGDTEFIFFLSPWSMLYWNDSIKNGELDSVFGVYKNAIGQLLSYNNVTVYVWTDEEMLSIIENLENYRDTIHYSKEVSQNIASRICNGDGKLRKDNYKKELENFYTYLKKYDYSAWEDW